MVLVLYASSLLFNEESVFSKPAGIDEEGNVETPVYLRDLADVFQGNRLATTGVIGDGDAAKGDIFNSGLFNQTGEFSRSILPLKG